MLRGVVMAAVVLTLVVGPAGGSPAAATAGRTVGPHKLTVVVKRNLAPAAEKKLAILVLITQNGGAPAAALATARTPLTVFLADRGLYRVRAEINSSCKGTCAGSYRISGSADHRLEVVPGCRPAGSGFVCSKVTIVKVY